MRKKFPNVENVFKVPNFVPITFLILALFIIITLTIFKSAYTVPGLIISLIGLPVYNYWEKKNQKRQFIPTQCNFSD